MRNFWWQLKNYWQNAILGAKSLRGLKRTQIPHILENTTKKEFYFLLTLLLIFALSGGFLITQIIKRGPGPHSGGTLIEGLVGQPQFINPVLSGNSGVDTDLARLVYASLLKFDSNENLTPDLAEKLPDISADAKTYTLKLKPNLKWQDGEPLTADDVMFTIQTIQNDEFQSPIRSNWSRVVVTKIDDLTLSFKLREVSVSFINNFTLGIIPKHIWESIQPRNFRLSDQNLKPIGAGPFAVSQIRKTSDGTIRSITMRANSNYAQGRPFLQEITFRFYDTYDSLISAYQGKDIQSLGFEPFDQKAFLAETENVNQYRINLPQYQAVFFNLAKNQILNEKAVRQALWLATDRDQIINDAYFGNAVGAFGPILEGSLGYNPAIAASVHNNLAEAATILTKAGWVMDQDTKVRIKNKKNLEFNLALNGNMSINVKTAQLLQSQWAEIGAKVNLVVVSARDLEQDYIRPRSFDALLSSENVGADPDPFAFWHSSQSHDPGLNLSGLNNAESDKLLTEARQTNDKKIREKDYLRFQDIINDQLPAIFLVRSQYIYNVPKKLQGISLQNIVHPSERFMDVTHWYFEK